MNLMFMTDIYPLSKKIYSVDGVEFVDFVDGVDFVECVDGVNAYFGLRRQDAALGSRGARGGRPAHALQHRQISGNAPVSFL
jgi:hypothetical protein